MFEYLSGIVAYKGEGYIAVDVGGVGYKVFTTAKNLAKFDGQCKIYIYMHIREDAMELYGFYSIEERNSFQMLISVSGVGCRVGLGIMNCINGQELALAIINGDGKTITKAPGVGPKLAQRIILELKDKVKKVSGAVEINTGKMSNSQKEEDVISALMVLGFTSQDANKALKNTDINQSVEDIIRICLKNY